MTADLPSEVQLGPLMHRLMDVARAGDPSLTAEALAGSTRQVQGLKSVGEFSGLSVVIDEPIAFGGTGSAPNPAEVALAALGASLEVTLRCYAAYLGVPIDSVGVDLSGAMDIRGFFQTDDGIPPGFVSVGAKVIVTSPAPKEDLDRLFETVRRCCPMLDLFRRPHDVALTFDRR